MAIVAVVLTVILVIVMVLYFRQFSRLQDALEDRAFLQAAYEKMREARDGSVAAYGTLSKDAKLYSDKLVSILNFLMEEAKVDPLYVAEKGGVDKAVFEYVHGLKSALKAEAKAFVDANEIISKLRSRRTQMISRIMLLAYGSSEHVGQWDVAMLALDKKLQSLQDFKSYVHLRLDEAGIDKCEEQNAINGCRIGSRLDIALLGLGLIEMPNGMYPRGVQEPDTGTTRPDTLDGLATVLGRHDDPRADVMPGLDPSLRGEAILSASAGAHGDEASTR